MVPGPALDYVLNTEWLTNVFPFSRSWYFPQVMTISQVMTFLHIWHWAHGRCDRWQRGYLLLNYTLSFLYLLLEIYVCPSPVLFFSCRTLLLMMFLKDKLYLHRQQGLLGMIIFYVAPVSSSTGWMILVLKQSVLTLRYTSGWLLLHVVNYTIFPSKCKMHKFDSALKKERCL